MYVRQQIAYYVEEMIRAHKICLLYDKKVLDSLPERHCRFSVVQHFNWIVEQKKCNSSSINLIKLNVNYQNNRLLYVLRSTFCLRFQSYLLAAITITTPTTDTFPVSFNVKPKFLDVEQK